MKILMNIAGAADAMIGISLLLVGMYLFFIQRDFMQGAIVLGANSLWSIDKILTNKYLFHPEGK